MLESAKKKIKKKETKPAKGTCVLRLRDKVDVIPIGSADSIGEQRRVHEEPSWVILQQVTFVANYLRILFADVGVKARKEPPVKRLNCAVILKERKVDERNDGLKLSRRNSDGTPLFSIFTQKRAKTCYARARTDASKP